MPGVSEQLNAALAHHQAGRLEQAETIYRAILARDPRNADAHHLLGMAAFQQGDLESASSEIAVAIQIAPSVPPFHNNLGLVFEGLGRREQALAEYECAVRLAPAYPEALANLGKALAEERRFQESLVALHEAVRVRPEFAEAWLRLGCAALGAGALDDAVRAFENALALQPRRVESEVNLSCALKSMGRFAESEAACRRALALKPDLAEAHANLGAVLLNLQRYGEAETACREALRLNSGLAEPWCNLGAILLNEGRVEEARACCEEAMRRNPNSPEALNNLGNALRAQNQLEEARAYFERALAAAPDHFEAWLNLSSALRDLDRLEDSMAACREALRRRPDSARAHNNLGNALRGQGRLGEAEQCFREAIRLQPSLAEPYANWGGVLKDQGRLEEALAACRQAMELDPKSASPSSNFFFYLHYGDLCPPETVYEEHRLWGLRQRELAAAARPHTNDRNPDRRLRVGYVSPDFRNHSVAFFVEPALAAHNRRAVEVYCYSNVARPDAVTQRIRAAADHWRDIRGMKDTAAADLIRADGIDILVDLAGHTAGTRLMALARKPAPVQATWCGYPATTGLEAIDYRVTDGLCDPPGGADGLHTEKLVRLPAPFTCYRPPDDAPEVGPLPARETGAVTFGSFNFLAKVTPRMIAAWSALLTEVPGSKLALKSAPLVDEATRRLVWQRFQALGIPPERVLLLGPVGPREHLASYHRIDIALDTFPYHGTTTTCEALWMGVPVVTLAGATHASRVGVSLLESVGLGDWTADSIEDYVERAARAARDLDGLAALRAGLRAQMAASPLMDAARFARNLEDAYRRMWRRWCERGQPEAIQ